MESTELVCEAEGLCLLLSSLANRPNSPQFCTTCLLCCFLKTVDTTFVEAESMKSLKTARKEVCEADPRQVCGTQHWRSSHIKHFSGRYRFPRSAKRQGSSLKEQSTSGAICFLAGVISLSEPSDELHFYSCLLYPFCLWIFSAVMFPCRMSSRNEWLVAWNGLCGVPVLGVLLKWQHFSL